MHQDTWSLAQARARDMLKARSMQVACSSCRRRSWQGGCLFGQVSAAQRCLAPCHQPRPCTAAAGRTPARGSARPGCRSRLAWWPCTQRRTPSARLQKTRPRACSSIVRSALEDGAQRPKVDEVCVVQVEALAAWIVCSISTQGVSRRSLQERYLRAPSRKPICSLSGCKPVGQVQRRDPVILGAYLTNTMHSDRVERPEDSPPSMMCSRRGWL